MIQYTIKPRHSTAKNKWNKLSKLNFALKTQLYDIRCQDFKDFSIIYHRSHKCLVDIMQIRKIVLLAFMLCTVMNYERITLHMWHTYLERNLPIILFLQALIYCEMCKFSLPGGTVWGVCDVVLWQMEAWFLLL